MKKIVRFQIISFIVVCIVGTLLHFTFEWSGNNRIVAAFSSTNESTWEHLKLVFYPMLIMTVIGYFYLGKDVKNYLCAKTLGIIYAISFIVIFFYTYTGIIGKNFAFLDIGSFFVAVFIGEYIAFKNMLSFDDECNNGSEMPLLHREMLEDDGGSVLTVSRSGRKNCNNASDGYAAFAAKMGMTKTITDENGEIVEEKEIAVDTSADAEPAQKLADQVRSWVVANGQTLREVLQNWCDKEGWDLVWATSREYPIEASAVFKGRFVDVASALVRNFGRATPVPYAKFYKGNRVLVITTSEE